MCTIISPFTLQQNVDRINSIADALEHTAKTIWRTDEIEEDFMTGTANTINCIAYSIRELADEFESLKNWAEDANIQIVHQRFYGKGTRLDVDKADPHGPDVMLSTVKSND